MIMAAAAVAVVSCSKRTFDNEQAPVMPDANAPVVFGAQTSVDVQSKATAVSESMELGVLAFTGENLPSGSSAATGVVWGDAENMKYTWQDAEAYKPASPNVLYWPATGNTTTKLSFASYFPYSDAGVSSFTLTQDMKDQSTAPDYAFAWAKLEGVGRPNPIEAQKLMFDYKVAKLTLSIIADGTTVGAGTGIKMQQAGSGEGVVSIKVYGGGTGFYQNYSLDLLTGTPSGSTDLEEADPMVLMGTDQEGSVGKPSEQAYVEAVGYMVPSTDAGLKSNGIVVAIEYNDGTTQQTYTAELKTGTGSLSGDAAFANGIVANNNYKYTLKLGKAGITFTGQVNDWNDVDAGEDIELQ